MNIQLKFDSNGIIQNPRFILGTRKASKLGLLSCCSNVNVGDFLDDSPSISFDVYKYNNNIENPLYNDLTTFKLVYVPEYDTWFEAIIEETESDDNGAMKHVSLTRLGEAELSQIRVYGLNVNTEDSIIYDENYAPTILYNPNDPAHSLLNRVLSFAPHYSVGYVAPTVRNIQRTFQFNDQTILDCLKNIAEEESLFIILDSSDANGSVNRTVSVYDVLSSCSDCGYRGFFTHTCPKCESSNVVEGYGEDTNIVVTSDALGNDLTISTNTESIANCYHLQAGDDIMTAAIRQCNPNGTGYIWNFTNEMLNEMSYSLRQAINSYNNEYNDYMSSHEYLSSPPTVYNALVNKYREIDEDFKVDPINNIIGYPAVIKAWYDALDFYYFLKTSLMPSETTDDLTAQIVATQLYTQMNNTTVAIGNTNNLSLAAASTAVMNNARLIANTIYEISVQTQTLNQATWTGTLMVQNFYNKDDKAVTQMMTVTVNDNLSNYISGKVMKILFNTTQGESTVVAMYNQTPAQVEEALQYYSLDELTNINKSFNGALEILSKFKADQPSSELYNTIYVPTKDKLDLVQAELQLREQEVNLVQGFVNTIFNTYITGTQTALNFENYLGSELWVELNSFRREANFSDNNYVSTTFRRKFSYSDSAYISDSLTNAEIVERAYEFLVQAEQKMSENNKYSYQINSSLKNLLVIPQFESIRDKFKCGNWIRVKTDNGDLYKLRLVGFEMSFDNPENLTVNFSDISNTSNIRSAQQIIAQSVDMVKNPKKYTNPLNTRFTSITDDIQCDYVVNDSFNTSYTNDDMETTFNVLDGLIEGKISAEDAESIIRQTLESITLSVENGNRKSVITLNSGNIHIESEDITLGGTVVFESDLSTAGQTIIDGGNIITGEIKSANYRFTDGIYSDNGTLLSLLDGMIRTPGFYLDSNEGIVHIKVGGYIGDSEIITADYSTSVNHSNHTWKLRSAAIDGNDTNRFYAYLTKNKNFIVSNDELGGHNADNDVTDLCCIGSKNYPWGSGYFQNLYVNKHSVIPEGVRITLNQSDWENFIDDTYVINMRADEFAPGDTFFSIAVTTENDLYLCQTYNIQASCVYEGWLTFISNNQPDDDVSFILLVEDYIMADLEKPKLTAEFNQIYNQLTLTWDSPNAGSKLITWVSDEIVIEKLNENTNEWEEVAIFPAEGEDPFGNNEFAETPLIIGSKEEDDG